MSLLERSLPLIGKDGEEKLNKASVIVFGVGGVGSWCAEALVRSGIGKITVVDGDTVSETNRNRQAIALCSTIGKKKAHICAERLNDINPDCEINGIDLFYSAETKDLIELSDYDFIADCIDTVSSKLVLIKEANNKNIPIISSMGTGNRLDPSKIVVKDVFETSGDGLARVMRKELRARSISQLTVVCSSEAPGVCAEGRNEETRRATPSSSIFVPAAAGIRIAYEIVNSLLKGSL